MRKITCVIIEDEELGRELLENYISKVPHLELISKFSNAIDALAYLDKTPPDLIFLDIQMPEMTGIEFLKALPSAPAAIFTTAYSNYAVEGYELSAIDYLLKPFGFTRFLQAVNKASEIIRLRRQVGSEKIAPSSSENEQPLEYLLIKADNKVHRLYVKDIVYIQSMKEYVVYYTDQEKIMSLGSLKGLEEKLPLTKFIRIHKSYIVAKNRVKSLEGNQLHLEKITLPIGGLYKKDVTSQLF